MRQRPGQLVTNGGSPSVVTLGLDPRVQGKDSLFCRGVNIPKKRNMFFLDARIRKHDGGGGSSPAQA